MTTPSVPRAGEVRTDGVFVYVVLHVYRRSDSECQSYNTYRCFVLCRGDDHDVADRFRCWSWNAVAFDEVLCQ